MRCYLSTGEYALAVAQTVLFGAISPFEEALQRLSPAVWLSITSSVEIATSRAAEAGAQRVADILQSASPRIKAHVLANSAPLGAKLCTSVVESIAAARQRFSADGGDPFDELLRWAAGLAESHYRRYARWLGGSVGLTIGPRDGPPYASAPRLGLSASTEPPDATAGRAAEVDLRLVNGGMNLETAASAPYLLVHECVCHAGQGSTKVANKSTFSEGWMDRAAEMIFDASAAGLEWYLATSSIRRLAAELIVVLEHPESGTVNWQHRRTGRRVASDVAVLYERRSKAAGRDAFLELSLALNAAAMSPDEKDLFVASVEEKLWRKSTEVTLMRSLADWKGSGDPVERLVALVCQDHS